MYKMFDPEVATRMSLTRLTQEFTCFSYDENGQFHSDASSLRYYYTPRLGADLSHGFDTFQKEDDSVDGHLDTLLKAIAYHEQKEGKKIDVNVVTWRGMMTKVRAMPLRRDVELISDCDRSWQPLLREWTGKLSSSDLVLWAGRKLIKTQLRNERDPLPGTSSSA